MKSKSGRIPVLLFLSALALLLVITGGCAYITGEAIMVPPPSLAVINNITPEEANNISMFSSFYTQFIDVRTPQEYVGGHIANAININFNAPDFKKNIGALDKNVKFIVYCQTGVRSAAASKVMAELGFNSIDNMLGGFSAWEAAGFPVTK
jgi:rhodanese-related sulfurtransferase